MRFARTSARSRRDFEPNSAGFSQSDRDRATLAATFAPAYARYLKSLCALDVGIVSSPHDVVPGEILLVEGDAH